MVELQEARGEFKAPLGNDACALEGGVTVCQGGFVATGVILAGERTIAEMGTLVVLKRSSGPPESEVCCG